MIFQACCINKSQKIIYDETKVPMFRQQLLNCQGVLNQLIGDVNIGQIDCIVQSFTNVLYCNKISSVNRST